MALAMTIGSVTLSSFEVPQRLEDLGGFVALEVHDFPGGIRTIQTFGAFPGILRWKGMMMGTFAMPRITTLDQIRLSQQPVTLSYGPKAFIGILGKLRIRARTQWFVEYEAEFVPSQDLSNSQTPNISSYSSLLNSQALYLQQAYNGLTGFGIPASLLAPTNNVISAIQLFTSAAATPTAGPNLVAAAGGLQKSSAQYMNVADSSTASPAADLNTRAGVIMVLASSKRTGWVVETVNPNLFALAAQYYGDASDWTVIAKANNLVDPQPLGNYTLVVPATP